MMFDEIRVCDCQQNGKWEKYVVDCGEILCGEKGDVEVEEDS